MSVQVTTPIGRLVGGHPIGRRTVMKKGQPVKTTSGENATEIYFGFAIPKTPGLDWKQEPWGALIVQAANEGWTGGQSNTGAFAWKITDGDSAVPNTKNIAPNSREGYPGHWVLQLSTQLVVKAYHVGKYDPIDQIQNANEIKPGDYGRVLIEAKANFPAESPGVYLNPSLFELARAGELIILDTGPSAADAFGGGQAAATTNTATAAAGGEEAAPPPAAPDFLNGEEAAPPPTTVEKFIVPGGKQFTRAALIKSGWQAAAIDALPRA